jgi:hypothetical protein
LKYKILVVFTVLLFFSGCAVLQTITNISRLKFKIDSADGVMISNIPVSGKSKLSDFNSLDILKLSSTLASGKMPVSFYLNVAAQNPNDGSGGYGATDITLKSFAWDLFVNNKKTISGNIAAPVVVPGVGERSIIPLKIEIDLVELFGNGGLNEVLNLALKLGGKEGSTSNLFLTATPVIGTPIGDIAYPDPITIVDYTYN